MVLFKSAAEKKILAFRSKAISNVAYDEAKRTLKLKAGKFTAELELSLIRVNNDLILQFCGDVVAKDPEALSAIMQAMWDGTIPELPDSDELREQLGKPAIPVGRPIGDEAPTGDVPTAVKRPPIFFRDMARRVHGQENAIELTITRIMPIDK